MPARMPTPIAVLSTLTWAAALLLAASAPASADAGGPDYDATAFDAPAPHHRVRRLPPPGPAYRRGPGVDRDPGPPGYGPPALVRAYLPRNHALPMYNEPPAR